MATSYPVQGRGNRKVVDVTSRARSQVRVGDWSGIISIGKTRWEKTDWTGTASAWLRIYYDATTAPAYTDEADYESDWGDQYRVVRVRDLYATYGHYHVDRA